LIFLRLALYGTRQRVDLLQKHTMGILYGENWGSFCRVRLWKAETRSALITSLSTRVPVTHVTISDR